jgi:hypothetical protein
MGSIDAGDYSHEARWAEAMKRVSVIFTEHEENGLANIAGLVGILERIKPEVIFLECPPSAFDNYLKGTHAKLESTAVNRYREIHPVELVPVDLPTPDAAFFANYRDFIERIARTGPEYDRLARLHREYVCAYGFAYLNSAHCSDLFSKLHEASLTALARLADEKLAERYDSWIETNKARERGMMTNIENHSRRVPFSRAAFLVGAAHRQSIIDLSASEPGATSSTIQWDFASIPVEPNVAVTK